MYRSVQNYPVFGRWSYSFAAIMAVTLLVLCYAMAISAWKYLRRSEGELSVGKIFLDLAVLSWGVGYLIGAVDDPSNGGRIADLNMVGAITPAAIIFEWLALGFVISAFASFVWKSREQRWGNAGLVLCSVVVVLVLCEGVVRAWTCANPIVQGFPTNSSALWNRRHVQFNQSGYRDIEHVASKRTSNHRLLVVGDSYAFGWGIDRIEDRFGEVLAEKLQKKTGDSWESVNVSHPDTHTLDHITFLDSALSMQPDVVILLYVFNDIDYLHQVTHRDGQSEAPRSFLERIEPTRVLYKNLYLFQELYVRARLISYASQFGGGLGNNPYDDNEIMERHMQDLSRFVSMANAAAAKVFIVPFDISVIADPAIRIRYQKFIARTLAAGLQTWSTEDAFSGYKYDDLTVNALDRHPNEIANRVIAEAVIGRLVGALK